MRVPKLYLDGTGQSSNSKTATVCVAAPIYALDIWPDHLSHHPATFKKMMNCIFLVIFYR